MQGRVITKGLRVEKLQLLMIGPEQDSNPDQVFIEPHILH